MPVARFAMPDGRVGRFEVPDGTSPEQAQSLIEQSISGSQDKSYSPGFYAGITGRAISQGISSPANLIEDLPIMAINKIAGTNIRTGSQLENQLMDKIGFPNPETPPQRVYSDVVAGASNPLNILGGPMGFVAGGTSGLTGGVTREIGGNSIQQFLASLAGGFTPSAITEGIPAAVRGAIRGGPQSAEQMKNTIGDFQAVGTTPTVGQASQNPAMRWLESTLSKTPGGMGPLINKAETQAQEMGAGVDQIAAGLSPKSSGETAGRAIQSGIVNNFIPNSKATQSSLYDKLDNFIPLSNGVDVSNTKSVLSDINSEISGAPNVSKFFQNSKIMGIENALKKDTETSAGFLSREDISPVQKLLYQKLTNDGNLEEADQVLSSFTDGKLPYEAVKKLRTLVGKELEDISFSSDVPRSKWKAVYAGLSSDMEQAAKRAGPQAEAAFKRANNYTNAMYKRIDVLQNVLDKNGGPEKIFQSAISGTSEGATTFRAVMRSVPQDGKKIVAATILRRLGKATPGNQNELGDAFSANTFLTNWNKLSPEAKSTMSGPFGKQFSGDLGTIAKVAENLKKGSKVYANPSGTSQAVANTSALGAFIFSLFTGHIGGAGAIAGSAGAANLAARGLTNPRFVRWLAQNSRKPISALPGALNALSQVSQRNGDPETADYVKELQNSYQGENKQ